MDFVDDFAKEFMQNVAKMEKKKKKMNNEEAKIFEIVQKISDSNLNTGTTENKNVKPMPKPSDLSISTRSSKCYIGGLTVVNEKGEIEPKKIKLHLGRLLTIFSGKIFTNFFGKNKKYPVRALKSSHLKIHYDDAFILKNKVPYVKYNNQQVNPYIKADCEKLVEELKKVEDNMLTKQGRQKDKADNLHFYNSCSVVIKPNKNTKCITIKLFNNGGITITGSKEEMDGYKACCILLEELKKEPSIFLDEKLEDIEKLTINGFGSTMINSNYELNFKLDLDVLFRCIEKEDKDIYKMYDSDRYRGLKVGFFWNDNKGDNQDGICRCPKKCKGKGKGTLNGECKKVTIAIFKSGSIIITGGRTDDQTDKAYQFINNIISKHYSEVMKVSIMDMVEAKKKEEIDLVEIERVMIEERKQREEEEKNKKEENNINSTEVKRKKINKNNLRDIIVKSK